MFMRLITAIQLLHALILKQEPVIVRKIIALNRLPVAMPQLAMKINRTTVASQFGPRGQIGCINIGEGDGNTRKKRL